MIVLGYLAMEFADIIKISNHLTLDREIFPSGTNLIMWDSLKEESFLWLVEYEIREVWSLGGIQWERISSLLN